MLLMKSKKSQKVSKEVAMDKNMDYSGIGQAGYSSSRNVLHWGWETFSKIAMACKTREITSKGPEFFSMYNTVNIDINKQKSHILNSMHFFNNFSKWWIIIHSKHFQFDYYKSPEQQ